MRAIVTTAKLEGWMEAHRLEFVRFGKAVIFWHIFGLYSTFVINIMKILFQTYM